MSRLLFLAACSLTLACGDDGGRTDALDDAGLRSDAGVDGGAERDGGTEADAGAVVDAGSSDAGATSDAFAETDAGPGDDLGTSPCSGTLFGSPCTDSCSRGYECVDGACMPSMTSRPGCGGFAGAICTTRAFPNCIYYAGSDYGPCLSEEEAACACRSPLAERFQCTGR